MVPVSAARLASLTLALIVSACACNQEKALGVDAGDGKPTERVRVLEEIAPGSDAVGGAGSGGGGAAGGGAGSGGAGIEWIIAGAGPGPTTVDGVCVPAAWANIPIPKIGQQSSALCWAAVMEMIAMALDKTPPPQCEQVENLGTGCSGCVGCPGSKAVPKLTPCNPTGWPDFSLAGLKRRFVLRALTLAELQREISCFRRPVAFSWSGGGSTAHIMVAYGYDGETISTVNPLPMCGGDTAEFPYATYVGGDVKDVTSHIGDFFEIQPI